VNDSRILAPVLLGIDALNDPIQIAESLSLDNQQGFAYNSNYIWQVDGINPGLHWDYVKD
jgi:hypothetical protein